VGLWQELLSGSLDSDQSQEVEQGHICGLSAILIPDKKKR
jgi:hypothetical protein